MGRKSVKENKNMFQTSRENAGMTREKASETMGFISDDRIERVESGKSMPHPDEVLAMSEAYGDALLCNRYCSGVCPIGKKYVPEVELSNISQITLEILSSLTTIEEKRKRMIEIAADGVVDEGEKQDFNEIRGLLDSISVSVKKLQVWTENIDTKK